LKTRFVYRFEHTRERESGIEEKENHNKKKTIEKHIQLEYDAPKMMKWKKSL